MNRARLAFLSLTICALAVVGSACSKSKTSGDTSPNLQRLILQLHWIPDPHQIGFWTALDKGIYKKYGLDVVVRPGGLDANPIKDVLGGSADIGQVGGIEQVCVAVSEGLPVRAIASIQRETPHALISLSSKPIRSPADFKGKTIAVAYGDTAELLLKSYMLQEGIDESTLTLVPFKFDLTPLLAGQVDAITGFSTGQPAILEKMGRTPVVLSYAAGGVSSYGYTLLVSKATLKSKPALIAAFLKASREGWDYSFAHPEEAISLMKKRFASAVDEPVAVRELTLIKTLMEEPGGRIATWKLENGRVNGVLGFLRKRGQLKGAITASSVYDNSLTD